jgi:hypothetical protein
MPVTEAEWLAATDAQKMMSGLIRSVGDGPFSNRKTLLFGCACLRRDRTLFGDRACRQAIDVIERSADGLADDDELVAAGRNVRALITTMRQRCFPGNQFEVEDAGEPAARPTRQEINRAFLHMASLESLERLCRHRQTSDPPFLRVYSVIKNIRQYSEPFDSADQPGFLRDVVGLMPFRQIVLSSDWRARASETVSTLALSIYDNRSFTELPLLADALEDAGCTDAELLGHLRSPGPHVRGCWAVDVVLGKS